MGVLSTKQFLDDGMSYSTMRRQLALVGADHIRRGWVSDTPAEESLRRYRDLVVATALSAGEGTIVSHLSAAVLHALPIPLPLPDVVDVLRTSHGCRHKFVRARQGCARGDEVVIDGALVTSLERTAVDCARVLLKWSALAVADAALRVGGDRTMLAEHLAATPHGKGIGAARFVVGFADPGAESPAESASRLRIRDAGFPPPELQRELFDDWGRFVARVDFFWPDIGLVGECDGLVKYTTLVPEGSTAADVIRREQVRQRRIEELGLGVVRWNPSDLVDLEGFRRILGKAFAERGHPVERMP